MLLLLYVPVSIININMIQDEYNSDASDFSDDAASSVTYEDASKFELRFGKYKGKKLEEMIKNGKRRAYLRYLLGWDELKYMTRLHIKASLNEYDKMKKEHQDNQNKTEQKQ